MIPLEKLDWDVNDEPTYQILFDMFNVVQGAPYTWGLGQTALVGTGWAVSSTNRHEATPVPLYKGSTTVFTQEERLLVGGRSLTISRLLQ